MKFGKKDLLENLPFDRNWWLSLFVCFFFFFFFFFLSLEKIWTFVPRMENNDALSKMNTKNEVIETWK